MTFENFQSWVGNNFSPPFSFSDKTKGALFHFSASVRVMGESGEIEVYGGRRESGGYWGSHFTPKAGNRVVVRRENTATEALGRLMARLDPSEIF